MITLKMLDRPEPDYKYLIPQSLWCRLHNIHTLCVRSWNGGLHSRQVIATVIVDWAEKAEMLEEIL